jgi:hypothetical protein
VTLDVDGLRALITGTGKMTDAELEGLTEENVDQLLLRMKNRDARFNYEITYSRDRVLAKPEVSPGEVFSFMKGQQQLNLGSAPIQGAQATRERWLNAKVGDSVGVCYGPIENAVYRKT